jgi:hypothetical protein
LHSSTPHTNPPDPRRSFGFIVAVRVLVLVLVLQLSAPALLHCGNALWAMCEMETVSDTQQMPAAHDCCPDSESSPKSKATPIAPQLADAASDSACGTVDCHCFHASPANDTTVFPEAVPVAKFSTEQIQPELRLLSGFSLSSPSGLFLQQQQPDEPTSGQQLSSSDLRAKGYGSAPEPLRIMHCRYLI